MKIDNFEFSMPIITSENDIKSIIQIFDAIKNISVKSRMTLYRRLKRLTENGYVAKGVLESHADTFYLLEKGKNV